MKANRSDMLEYARKQLGPNADIEWDEDRQRWNILTDVEEDFNIEDYADTPFYETFVKDGKIDHYEWERWARKNGASGMSDAEQVEEYNRQMKEYSLLYAARVMVYREALGEAEAQKIITNLEEVLAYAKEQGITLESARKMRDRGTGRTRTLADFERELLAKRGREMRES